MNRCTLWLGLILVLFATTSCADDTEFFVDLIECESSGRHDAVGDDGLSVGILQFREDTFNEMKVLSGHRQWRWKNPIHQMRLALWMINNGYGKRWTCYRKLTSEVK